MREVYEAFHGAVDAFANARQAAGQLGAVVSIHSFTPVYRDVERPWQIGLIFDRDERYARSVEAGLKQDPALIVGMNEPYSPADRVFHTLERHAERRGLRSADDRNPQRPDPHTRRTGVVGSPSGAAFEGGGTDALMTGMAHDVP